VTRSGRSLCDFMMLTVVAVGLGVPAVAEEPHESLAGKFLVATEAMSDPRFTETVIYMVRHGEDGAMGLVINRPLARVSAGELLESFGLPQKDAVGEVTLHYGGPVEPSRAFVLHSSDYEAADSYRVSDGIALSTDPEMFEAIAAGNGPEQTLVALGYAGWAPGQLDSEIIADSWTVVPADRAMLFSPDPTGKWHRALNLDGFEI